jgi:hypothetical protein
VLQALLPAAVDDAAFRTAAFRHDQGHSHDVKSAELSTRKVAARQPERRLPVVRPERLKVLSQIREALEDE